MKKLTILGSVNADHVIHVPHFSAPGETVQGVDYQLAFGGKGANQAVAAARLKSPELAVEFLACVGDDAIGERIKTALSQDGMATQGVESVAGATGMAFIQVNQAGENSIVLAAGANNALDSAFVERHANAIAQSAGLLLQLETPLKGVLQAAEIAHAHQVPVILNPAPARPLPNELYPKLTMITPNETETALLTGIQVTDDASARQAAQFFHHKGVQWVVITLGAKGVFVSEMNGHAERVTGFCVQPKDTTAAGDTFNGALVAAWLAGENLSAALRYAQAAAAISVTRLGAQPSIPSRAETLQFLADHA